MNVRLLAKAESELLHAVAHYNNESPGLGYEFMAECTRTMERITLNPNAWQRLSKRTRRAITNRFPYGIIYQQRPDGILVVAVMHLHRHPESWR